MSKDSNGPSKPCACGQSHEDKAAVIDVRTLPPRDRHPLVMSTFASLAPTEAFVLVNDHDPKPLYYQFAAEHTDEFSWEYLEQGPEVWRVRIGKARKRT